MCFGKRKNHLLSLKLLFFLRQFISLTFLRNVVCEIVHMEIKKEHTHLLEIEKKNILIVINDLDLMEMGNLMD